MVINQEESIILIIDIQEKLLNAVFNKEQVESNSKILVQAAKILNIPVFITEQYPKGLGKTVNDMDKGARVYEKITFNALANEELEEDLLKVNKKQIVILGIETHICVHQTVEALLDKGFDVVLVKDACGSRSETEYLTAIDYMKSNGANIKTTEMILFELLKTAKHPNFKEIQNLIK